jgi:hypothetical protein
VILNYPPQKKDSACETGFSSTGNQGFPHDEKKMTCRDGSQVAVASTP